MAISMPPANGLHHTFPPLSPPITFSFSRSPSLLNDVRVNNNNLHLAAISSTATSIQLERHVPSIPFRKHQTLSYTERKSAIDEIQQSSDLGHDLERLGLMLRVQDLNIILRHFGKLDRRQELSQLFDWMQKHQKVNISSYSGYMKFMGRNLSPLKALEVYDSIKDESMRINASVCNSVLSCLIKNGKFESSMRRFEQMKKDGLKADIITYSTLLAGCTKIEDGYSKALGLVQELQFNGLELDSVTYGTLLAICASNKKCREAEEYFERMKDEGHSPNLFHYSSLLNAYSADGDYKKADKLIEDMKSSGLVPNKVMLTTLLKVYIRGGLFERSRELLSELEVMGYAQEEMPYCLLMDGLAKAGQIQEAKDVFNDMMKKHVKCDGYSHSIMISAFCRGGLLDEAKLLADNYEATYGKYDLVVLNTMLCAYCRAGEMESVVKTMKKLDEAAIVPDWNTYHILIRYFCKQKLYLLAYRTLQDMHKKGHQPVEEICSTLIYHLGQASAYAEAFSVYNILRYSKRTMCKALHEKILFILLTGQLFKDAYVVVKDNGKFISQPAIKKFVMSFVKLGNINLVNDVFKTIHNSDFTLHQDMFHMAISRYLTQPEKKDLLVQLLEWMPGQGYFVDSTTRNLLLKNSDFLGRQLTANILSKQHLVSKKG
ncbi:pentatricopeptide repeat-containing protein At1g10910, chloroplastic isoform X2 [Impatiens glandulifera]|uniref:pentatricopeptide repeat-containing protein At1g10910, chloroplastic isoform X2 n=1 Tax=Impatiens glandulifera TaxID=253017 RepID=UPI001FB050B7|nr:pentatricopeptide repeat-containing protein At1g10910, chloroplastic isoform X2 [Impatiens glandulifera]